MHVLDLSFFFEKFSLEKASCFDRRYGIWVYLHIPIHFKGGSG